MLHAAFEATTVDQTLRILLWTTHQKDTQGTADSLKVTSGVHGFQGSPMSRSGAKSCACSPGLVGWWANKCTLEATGGQPPWSPPASAHMRSAAYPHGLQRVCIAHETVTSMLEQRRYSCHEDGVRGSWWYTVPAQDSHHTSRLAMLACQGVACS